MTIVRYPDLICLGAQKSATTWLYDVMRKIPGVFLPPIKELHYFSQLYNADARNYGPDHRRKQADWIHRYLAGRTAKTEADAALSARAEHLARTDVDDAWYAEIFAPAPANSACVEICPSYMNMPIAGVQHVLRLNPSARLLVIVRDPVDRCWSQMRMHISQGMLSRDVETLAREQTSLAPFMFYTDYAGSLKKWERFAAPGQLRIVLYDDVAADPAAAVAGILDLVAVGPPPLSPAFEKEVFKGEAIPLPAALRRRLLADLAPQYEYLKRGFPDAVERWLGRHANALTMAQRGWTSS